jgi:Rad3-related DNA helicase
MPYPNPKDPILKEKINYLNTKAINSHSNKSENITITGTEYFENICMRAVNQSIGMINVRIFSFCGLIFT